MIITAVSGWAFEVIPLVIQGHSSFLQTYQMGNCFTVAADIIAEAVSARTRVGVVNG